ncbi:aminoacyl-tRNA hydrolase, partial [Planctomycetota bacterium]
GLADIIAKLGTNAFARCRVGIGASGRRDTVGHVLGRPAPEEREHLAAALARAHEATLSWLRSGVEQTMNDFNGL